MISEEQRRHIDRIIDFYQERVDFLSAEKTRRLDELLRRTKELKMRQISQKVKGEN